jgi:hypothetical protein
MGAGDWLSNAGFGDVLSATATRALEFALLTQTKNKTFLGHPVIRAILAADSGIQGMAGGLAQRFGLLTVGDKTMAATAVGSKAAATNTSAATLDITPSRRQLVINASDDGISMVGEVDLARAMEIMSYLVTEGTAAWENSYTAALLALISSLSVTAGTTGTPLTWAAAFNACIDFSNRGNAGPAIMILDAKGVKDLAGDMSSLGGAVAFSRQAQSLLDSGAKAGMVMEGFAGVADVVMLSGLPTSGADTYGAIVGSKAWRSKHKVLPFAPGVQAVYNVGLHRCEALRGDGTDVTGFSFTTYFGVGELDDNGGTRLIYKTT